MFGFEIRLAKLLIGLSLILCMAFSLLFSQEKDQATQSKSDENAQSYQLLAKGVVSSAPLHVQFKSGALRLEIRNLVMGRGQTESIPTPTEMLLEVRQGAVTATINKEKVGHSQGDFWVVDKGSAFTIQNSGEVAVVRAIYIFEGSR